MEGHVYILVNSSFKELIKIGRTTKTPESRALELSSTGTPGRFVVAYSVLVNNCIDVESEMHKIFSDKRHTNDREFFEVSSAEAINTLINISKGKKIFKHEKNENIENKSEAVLFLVKISSTVYRLGLIQKPCSYLDTQEFKNTLIDMYRVWNPQIIFDFSILDTYEFENIDNECLKKMLSLIDNYLTNLKLRQSTFSKNNYDLRTLSYEVKKEFIWDAGPMALHRKAFELTLSLIKPIASAIVSVNEKDDETKIINELNKLGL
jgi:hypothetical protein